MIGDVVKVITSIAAQTNLLGVADVTRITTESAGESQRAAAELSAASAELQALVGRFRF
jgi:methyl-accepting chemotaxis protein